MKRLVSRHPILTAAFVAAVAVAAILSVRAALFAFYWDRPGIATHPLQDWMTPRFIVHAYHVPPESVAAILGVEPGSSPRRSLAEIAASQDRPVAEVIAALSAVIAAREAAE